MNVRFAYSNFKRDHHYVDQEEMIMDQEKLLYSKDLKVLKLAVEEYTFSSDEAEEENLRIWVFQSEIDS
jgi:hypothetical protein